MSDRQSLSKSHLLVFALVFGLLGIILWKSMAAPNPNLQGDLNGDNTVDATDLSILLGDFGTTNSAADINGDGTVDVEDLSTLLSHYGQSYTSGSTSVQPPQAPTSYSLPGTAVDVSTTAQLTTAVSGSTQNIILENGTYANSAPLSIGNHRLWARNLGGATLQFGLQIGGNGSSSGGEIHGLKFNITDATTTADGAAIKIWGATAGQNAVIDDSWIEGNSDLKFGIEDRTTSGFKAQRLVLNDFTEYGVFFETNYPNYYTDTPAVEPVVSDISVTNVKESPAGASNGTAEAGVWAGTDCLCSRLKIRDTGWMGLWLGGNANNGVYSDVDINDISGTVPSSGNPVGVGVYLEHFSRSNVFENFVIGSGPDPGVRTGFNCEWANPAYDGLNPVSGQSVGACHFNTIKDGTIYTTNRGIQLEDAESTTIQNVTFIGQSSAAIDDYMTSGSGWSTIWQNQGNDFTGLKSGAAQYTNAY